MADFDVLNHYSQSKLLHKSKRTDVVALFLVAEIARRHLRSDERFPLNERQTAQALAVNRLTVGLAWKQLAAENIVEIKQGIGVVVTDPQKISSDEETLDVYFEVRKQSEMQLARLAALHRNHTDLKKMEQALEKLKGSVRQLQRIDRQSPDLSKNRIEAVYELFLNDLKFHAAIRNAAKDTWLEVIAEIAEARTQITRLASFSTTEYLKPIVRLHLNILEAIRVQDIHASMSTMKSHFEMARRSMRAASRRRKEIS